MLGSKEFPVTFVPEKNPPAGFPVNVIGDIPEHGWATTIIVLQLKILIVVQI